MNGAWGIRHLKNLLEKNCKQWTTTPFRKFVEIYESTHFILANATNSRRRHPRYHEIYLRLIN